MNHLFKAWGLAIILCGSFFVLAEAQEDFENWMHYGPEKSFPNGVQSENWYASMPKEKGKTVIVAVMDTGVDIEHPDLQGVIWVNPNEIPGNKIDDDGNGYVDDVNGWNFLGGPNGTYVTHESLEVTREYAKGISKWAQTDVEKLSGKKKKEYEAFLEMQMTIEEKQASSMAQLTQIADMEQTVSETVAAARAVLGKDSLDVARLEASGDEKAMIAAQIIKSIEEQGVHVESLDWLEEVALGQFAEQKAPLIANLDYKYNPEYDARKIIGDTYADFSNKTYGNNIVDVDFAYHGTHVAGIIAARRDNNMGMNGIADNVVIMPVNVVPDGDERDKDVANGIFYAVNNGAQVINMSFGKGYSPEKNYVDAALKYAARHDVLIVHGAGNSGENMDTGVNFPNDTYQKKSLFGKKQAPNLISVGAASPEGGESSIAEFSNYGKTEVDVFAPGVYIYSTTPDSTYNYASGTSMAAPVVSGVAALIRSRYPALSAPQVKEILIKSTRPIEEKVMTPGSFELVSAKELSVSGGIVDVVAAMKLAANTKGKAKIKNRKSASTYYLPAAKA